MVYWKHLVQNSWRACQNEVFCLLLWKSGSTNLCRFYVFHVSGPVLTSQSWKPTQKNKLTWLQNLLRVSTSNFDQSVSEGLSVGIKWLVYLKGIRWCKKKTLKKAKNWLKNIVNTWTIVSLDFQGSSIVIFITYYCEKQYCQWWTCYGSSFRQMLLFVQKVTFLQFQALISESGLVS